MWVPGSPGGPRLARGQPVVSVRGWGGGAAAILAPGEAGARLGWGLAVLRLLRTRPPYPAGRCDITPRKDPPTQGRPCPWAAEVGNPVLALPAVVHSPRPCGGLARRRGSGGSAPRQVLPVRACRCFPIPL